VDAKIEEYELSGPDADAKGVFADNGFLVKAGSTARRETVPSGKHVNSVHQRLLNDGILEEHEGRFRFAKDHQFKSPSGAAAAVLGRTANGWISWKRADGQTLSEIKRVSRDVHVRLLNENKREEITERHRQLLDEGKLPTPQQLDREYALFRERFGPSVLSAVDGESLLTLMHDHGNRESLVYWLEFKNDEVFETTKGPPINYFPGSATVVKWV
jgi:5-methylcytosine-specific restriction protein B